MRKYANNNHSNNRNINKFVCNGIIRVPCWIGSSAVYYVVDLFLNWCVMTGIYLAWMWGDDGGGVGIGFFRCFNFEA